MSSGYSISSVSNPAVATSPIDLLQQVIKFERLWMINIASFVVLIFSFTALILLAAQPRGEGETELQTVG